MLRPGGKAVFGDLMFRNGIQRARILNDYRNTGREELAEEIEDEFFWLVDNRVADLEALGLTVLVRQFSDLSWGIAAARAG